MASIELFQAQHLFQVRVLLDLHLSALAPGWSLTEAYVASKLQRDPGEAIVDPWVTERKTFCALERQSVVAAVHLLRYGNGPEVSQSYRDAGEINWLVGLPNAAEATGALLAAAHEQLQAWGVASIWAEMGSLAGPFTGVPDVWPHLATALTDAGFRPTSDRDEAVYGGRLDALGEPGAPPLAGLAVRRTSGRWGARFTALLDGQPIGFCECVSDISEGGALPALRGWGELAELEVLEAWRNRGVGTWLVQHALAWLRLGRCDRIVLAVAHDDEANGAGRFYERCGWRPLVRQQRGWQWQPAAEG